MTATVRIIVIINISSLPNPRPFDIMKAVNDGIAELHPSLDEDETMKDLVLEWPTPGPEVRIPYHRFMREYAAPLLAAGAWLQVIIDAPKGRAGFNGEHCDPRAWMTVNEAKLESAAAAKLAAVRKALEA
jgi:hypothetical protein